MSYISQCSIFFMFLKKIYVKKKNLEKSSNFGTDIKPKHFLYICRKLVRAQTLKNKHAKYCTCASSLIYGKQSSIIQFMIHILKLLY